MKVRNIMGVCKHYFHLNCATFILNPSQGTKITYVKVQSSHSLDLTVFALQKYVVAFVGPYIYIVSTVCVAITQGLWKSKWG